MCPHGPCLQNYSGQSASRGSDNNPGRALPLSLGCHHWDRRGCWSPQCRLYWGAPEMGCAMLAGSRWQLWSPSWGEAKPLVEFRCGPWPCKEAWRSCVMLLLVWGQLDVVGGVGAAAVHSVSQAVSP